MDFSRDKLQLCDIQGRLFELSADAGYASAPFVDFFMASQTAAALDRAYDRLQWAGEEYILEELEDESEGFAPAGDSGAWTRDTLYWTGYTYRYWHYLTGESSARIRQTADAATMRACWPGYHTLDVEAAVHRFREASRESA